MIKVYWSKETSVKKLTLDIILSHVQEKVGGFCLPFLISVIQRTWQGKKNPSKFNIKRCLKEMSFAFYHVYVPEKTMYTLFCFVF